MFDTQTLIMFTTASVLLGLSPGPDNIFVLTQSIMHGRVAGIIITLGLCTGLIVHTTLVAFGVAVIFQTSVIAFSILKYLGALYLLYLAWQAFRAPADSITVNKKNTLSRWQLYRRGIIMNITNPKVSIFFMAFLPQFADPEKGSLSIQLVFLGLIFIVSTILVFSSVSQLAGLIGKWISRSEKGQSCLHKVAGLVFVSLAIKLIFTSQK